MTITKCTIYGERCSGTNYIEELMKLNFDISITWDYGWKHFFGFQDEQLKQSDDTLFICIIRDIYTWINSFYRELHHLPLQTNTNLTQEQKIDQFLNYEFYSIRSENSTEIIEDRNIYTQNRYKNIFELRHTKIKFLLEDLPNKVKNYIFIKYEDLINDFENTMIKIKNKNIKIKENIVFPINSKNYKGISHIKYEPEKKINYISKDLVYNNPNFISYYEINIGYTINNNLT